MNAGEMKTTEPALVYTIQNLLRDNRLTDALGAFWLTASCACTVYARADWSIVTVEPGLQLHLCGVCGRPTNKEVLTADTPYGKGDVVFWCELLWQIVNEPGPTGAVTLSPLDADETVTVHVLQLNREA